MVIPSTFSDWHQGPSATFASAYGQQSRIDYIAVSDDMIPGIVLTFVDEEIDLFNGDVDHRPVILHLRLAAHPKKHSGFRRRTLYNRQALRDRGRADSELAHQITTVRDWTEDALTHWCYLRDHIQQECSRLFPVPRRQKHQHYFTDETWELVIYRKELEQSLKAQHRDIQRIALQQCFGAWAAVACTEGFVPDLDQRKSALVSQTQMLHQARMMFACTQEVFASTTQHFRCRKRQDWRHWMQKKLYQQRHDLATLPRSQLFKILKPKAIVQRAKGHSHRALPGLTDQHGKRRLGRQDVALAWQTQFGDIENAFPDDISAMNSSVVMDARPRTTDDLLQMPSLYELEDALRGLDDRKAPGLDAIGAEVFRLHIPCTAKCMFALLLKCSVRRHWIPELAGGWILPLFKHKGSANQMTNYRAIMLEPSLARAFARAWRPRLEAALCQVAAPMQWGGRKGLCTAALHLAVRSWQRAAQATRQSLGLIFIDIRSAFYTVVRPFLAGFDGSHDSAQRLFAILQLPPTVYPAFLRNLHQAHLVYTATESQQVTDIVAAMMAFSWFAVPNAQRIMRPCTGSRPGDPAADVLFALLMSRIMTQINERLDRLGLLQHPATADRCFPANLAWVDDLTFAAFGTNDNIASVVAQTVSVIMDVMMEHGFLLSLGSGKTAVLIEHHGQGATKARQRLETNFKQTLPVLTEHDGTVQVPLVNHYKHLGSLIVRGGSLLPELKVREAQALVHLRPLRRYTQDAQIAIEQRRTLIQSFGLSVLMHHAGCWHGLNQSDYQVWQRALVKIYRHLHVFDGGSSEDHRYLYQLAWDMRAPMPMEWLHLKRLALLVHMLESQDLYMIDLLHACDEMDPASSWLQAVIDSVQWWQEQIGLEALPPEVEQLRDRAAWEYLSSQVPLLKKGIQMARKSHLLRIRMLCEVRAHAQFQHEVLRDMQWEDVHAVPIEAPQTLHICQVCHATFCSPAALAVHQTHKHQKRSVLRRFAIDANCRACGRHYHTRARLLNHLQASSTSCWLFHLRMYAPLDPSVAAQLDEQDRSSGQAFHQRGLKEAQVDRVWRYCHSHELCHILPPARDAPLDMDAEPNEQELSRWSTLGCYHQAVGAELKPPGLYRMHRCLM
eukprot:Skav229331  [mRNA]  locus=scaffold2917:90227:93595:+ [translate_table: standard]